MVYVDALLTWPGAYRGRGAAMAARVGARNGNRWCHLFADTAEELHAFAEKLGMKREWGQGDHYDLTPRRRAAALAAGAQEIDRKQAVALRRRTR